MDEITAILIGWHGIVGRKSSRLYDSSWSNGNTCQACNKEKGTENTQVVSMSVLQGSQKSDPRRIRDMGAKSKNIEERLEVAGRNCDAPFE